MTTKPPLKNFSKENRATQKQNSKRVFIKIKDQMLISEASGWNFNLSTLRLMLNAEYCYLRSFLSTMHLCHLE